MTTSTSSSADGLWHHLRLVPELAVLDQPLADGDAACIVVQDGGMSAQLARMLKQAGQPVPQSKPVLEVNPEHPLVKKLDGSVHFNDLAHILFDQALLAEGGMPEDPAAYVKRVNALLV